MLVLAFFTVALAFPFFWMLIATFKKNLDLYTVENNPFLFKDDNNNLVFVDGFNAVVSWDAPTGVGTLIASSLALVLPQFVNANDGSNL